jgi:hypothetical protein
MREPRVKVLYIGGWGRSGSTILGNILGSTDGVFHAGELIHIWENGFLHNRACGCQAAFDKCAVWNDILTCAYGGRDNVDAQRMIDLRNTGPQNRKIPSRLRARSADVTGGHDREYLDNLYRLYAAIADVTGSRVIVDSSKHPSHAYALSCVDQLDVYMVHLIRDARATAYSWQRRVRRTDSGSSAEEYQEKFHPLSSAFKWYAWNLTLEMFRRQAPERYMRLMYEDFSAQPRSSVEEMLKLVGERPETLPFKGDRTATLGTNHTIWGNPVRTRIGDVEIRSDDEWKRKMRRLDRWKVSAISWPLLLRYGYYVNRE